MAITELKTNLDEYVGSCDDKTAELELAEEFSPTLEKIKKINEEIENLSNRDTEYLAKKSALMAKKIDIQRKNNQMRSQLQKKQPAVTKLYNLRAASRNGLKEGEKVDSQIKFDTQGNPFLKISKQMDGAVGFDFTITGDGKVIFGAMSDDKMAEVIDFLYRRGITGFELPAGAPRTPEEAQKRVEERKTSTVELDQQTFTNQVNNIKTKADQETTPRYIPAERDQSFSTAAAENNAMTGSTMNNTSAAQAGSANPPEGDSFRQSKDKLKAQAANQWKLRDNEGMFICGNVFSFYKDNSQNWYEKDGKEKKGVRKDDVCCRMELHEKDGKLSGISYYVGNNGKLDPKYAGQMVSLLKDAGYSVINFPKGIPDDDQEVLRSQCAKKGMIPSGSLSLRNTKLKDIRKMIKDNEEQNEGDPAKSLEYKVKLGQVLEKEALQQPVDTAKLTYAKELQKEEDYKRMHEFYGPIMQNIGARSRLYDSKRVQETSGAANAAETLFNLFENHGEESIPDLLNSPDNGLDEKQIAALRRFNTPENQDLKIQKMSKEAWREIYLALKVAETEKAAGAAKDVRNTLSDAQKACNNIIKTLQDKGNTRLEFNFDATVHKDTDTPQQTQTNNRTANAPQPANAYASLAAHNRANSL